MKVMLRCDQSRLYIDKADEIYVPYKRLELIEEIHSQYPNKTILLDTTTVDPKEINKNDIKMMSGLCRGKLKILVLYDFFQDVPTVNRILSYPMRSLYEMKIALGHGIKEFYIGAELLHQLDKVNNFKKRNEVIIRIKVNEPDCENLIGLDNNLLMLDSYILPQELNLDLINETIDYIDFETKDSQQEAAYYRIYMEDKEWPGAIKALIPKINKDNLVRMMEPTEIRFKCNMGCLSNSHCNYCMRNIELANPELYKKLEESQELEE